MKRLCSLGCLLAMYAAPRGLQGQRIYERGPELVLRDAQGRLTKLGRGFYAVPVSDHEVLIIRGAQMGYGEKSSCEGPSKNRVVLYDTQTKKDVLLFDKPIPPRIIPHDGACVYERGDLSPDSSTLYIVSPCYATSGCLALIDLHTGKIRNVPGVMDVFVIRGGPHEGELIYSRRLWTKPKGYETGFYYYPYIHAHPDGSQIGIISDENLVQVGGVGSAPILRAYLRRIRGRIFVEGRWIP